MSFDIAIFLAFLIINLVFGLYYGRGVTTVRGYAVGNKNFSTATLVSTIVATWVSGQFFFSCMSESYTQGLSFIWAATLGDFLCLLFIGMVCAPRMAEFLGNLSIAEAMGNLFGKHVRLITAISGVVGVIGIISVQLKIAGVIFEHALGIPGVLGVVSAGVIVTLYSSFGGIKSVTLTDVIQFGTFGVAIPALAYFLFYSLDNTQVIIDTLDTNPLFDYTKVFDLSASSTYYTFFLFLFCVTPSFNPAIFQRVSMAKNVNQVRNSFAISSVACFFLAATISWVAVLVLSIHPNLEEKDVFKFIIADSSWIVGFKGLLLAGIMAMVMSTVDSYINSSAVLLIHDLRKTLNLGVIKSELFTTRICALFIGFTAIVFTMFSGSFLQLFIWANMFFMPIVSVPFLLAIFGFRSTSKSVLLGMGAGLVTAITWELFLKVGEIDGLIPAMFANLVVLLSSHYLLGQSGGWVGIKEPGPLLEIRKKRHQKLNALKQEIATFNLIDVFKHSTPKGEGFVALIGLFIMISNFSTISALSQEVQMNYAFILDIVYPMTLCLATGLISYPLWLKTWKESSFLPVFWNFVLFFILICFNFFTVLISHFAEMQLMVFMINMIIVSCLVSWRLALCFIVVGVISTLCFYEFYSTPYQIQNEASSFGFKIIYLLLLVSSTLIIFLKPKQDHLKATEAKLGTLKAEVIDLAHEKYDLDYKVSNLTEAVGHYSKKIDDQQAEISRLGATAQKILDNVNHELRLPVGNVMNFAEMLSENLEEYDDDGLKQLSDEVYRNSTRLSTMILNMLDLATLNVKNVDLDKTLVNLSEIVQNRVQMCRKIYLQNKPIDFRLIISPEIMLPVDPNYIKQTVDNLVINAINFSEKGLIEIRLEKHNNMVTFTITDQGKGIPSNEIYDIFAPFKMGSNAESKAEGRGVGLALCKSVIEAHGGVITAKSKGVGASMKFVLPV